MNEPFQAPVTRDLVVVSGPDATNFLQSLCSQDLDAVGVGETVHTLLLQPQGKLLADFYAQHAATDEWRCVCECGFGTVLAEGLRRFKIRVKVEIVEVSVAALAVRGAHPGPTDATVIPVAWSGGEAYDVVGAAAAIDALHGALGLTMLDADAYERARIEAGVARQGFDTDERTIPQEAGLERDAVSFTKGCFVGQELVCRIDTRGHVNRQLRRLRAPGARIERGAEVVADGKTVGEVTSTAGDVALAMLRREVEPGATVTVAHATATVEAR
jgi:hypothetical protein